MLSQIKKQLNEKNLERFMGKMKKPLSNTCLLLAAFLNENKSIVPEKNKVISIKISRRQGWRSSPKKCVTCVSKGESK